jgi:phosphatidate cytidylyltransferase
MLRKRLITVAFVVPPVIFLVWYSVMATTVLALLWGGLAAWEFYHNIIRDGIRPLTAFGIALTALFIVNPVVNQGYYLPILLTASVVVPLLWLLIGKFPENAFARWSWTLAGAIYIGWLLSHLLGLRSAYNLPQLSETAARNWAFYALSVTIFSDSTAYFTGRRFGKHRLAPRISPGKTWEGTFGGFCGAVVAGLFFSLPTPLGLNTGYYPLILLAITASIFGQAGDLVKSLYKRNMGVKDSSNLLPGHGGFLDRLDSHLFAGVLIYYYVMLFVN